jgi:UPF0755 protein
MNNIAKKKKKGGCLIWVLILLLATGSACGIFYYLFMGNTLGISESIILKIENEENLESITEKLITEVGLKHPELFKLLAREMNVENNLRPSKIKIEPGLNKRQLAVKLRQGGVVTVDLILRGTLDIKKVPALLSEKFEPEEDAFLVALNNEGYYAEWGFNKSDIYAVFVPNTYNMYYYTSPEGILKRMHQEWLKYWNDERKARASQIGLSPKHVHILASIVDKETTQFDEMPKIAGVYLNRLKNNWMLQADPTVKFAMDSMSLKRILKVHTLIKSPFNTYYILGLPPGPICIPSLQSIESVLNAESHQYMYFCAKPDYSGYHVFSKTLDEHNTHAYKYHRFLDNEARKRQ